MKKYIKVKRSDVAGNYTQDVREISDAVQAELDDIEYLPVGTTITLTVVEMTEQEYESLPEFEGW